MLDYNAKRSGTINVFSPVLTESGRLQMADIKKFVSQTAGVSESYYYELINYTPNYNAK